MRRPLFVLLLAASALAGTAAISNAAAPSKEACGDLNAERSYLVLQVKTLTSPVTRVTRWITPRIVLDRHLGLVSFFLVLVLWFVLVVFKARQCLQLGYPQLSVPGC